MRPERWMGNYMRYTRRPIRGGLGAYRDLLCRTIGQCVAYSIEFRVAADTRMSPSARHGVLASDEPAPRATSAGDATVLELMGHTNYLPHKERIHCSVPQICFLGHIDRVGVRRSYSAILRNSSRPSRISKGVIAN